MKMQEVNADTQIIESLKPTLSLAQAAFGDFLASSDITSMLTERFTNPDANLRDKRDVLANKITTKNEEKQILGTGGYTPEESNLASVLITKSLVKDLGEKQALEKLANQMSSKLFPETGVARAINVLKRMVSSAPKETTEFDRKFLLTGRATEFVKIMQSLPEDVSPITSSAGSILNEHKSESDFPALEKVYATATKTLKEMAMLKKAVAPSDSPRLTAKDFDPTSMTRRMTAE